MSMLFDVRPIEGTWVRRRGDDRIGRVLSIYDHQAGVRLSVEWANGNTVEQLAELESGIGPGFLVQDVPWSVGRRTLGVGRVRAVRRLAGLDQALVQLEADGRSLWLPSFGLRRIMGPDLAFVRARVAFPDAGERFALGGRGDHKSRHCTQHEKFDAD